MTRDEFEKTIVDNLPISGYEVGAGRVLFETVSRVYPNIKHKLDSSVTEVPYSARQAIKFMNEAFILAKEGEEEEQVVGDL